MNKTVEHLGKLFFQLNLVVLPL
jgi:hypothetical protein